MTYAVTGKCNSGKTTNGKACSAGVDEGMDA